MVIELSVKNQSIDRVRIFHIIASTGLSTHFYLVNLSRNNTDLQPYSITSNLRSIELLALVDVVAARDAPHVEGHHQRDPVLLVLLYMGG